MFGNEVFMALGIVDVALNAIDDTTVLGCILGTAIDQWTVNKGKSFEEVHELLENLVKAHASVNEALGAMERTR